MVWITMSLAPHAGKKRKKSNSKPHLQINKCLNEKRRREQENVHIEELAELVSASPSDMSSLSCKPDKCAILKETVNQIRTQEDTKIEPGDELQESEVSSSKPNIINNNIFGSILLEALEGFLFVVDIDGKVEFVSENITAFLKYHQDEIYEKNIYDYIHPADRARFNQNLLLMMPMSNTNWTSENLNSAGKPVKHFNCQFLVRPEDPEIKMENKQAPINEYVNLSITANYMPLEDEGSNEVRNRMTCIARRVATEEKRATKVEHFTTKTDREGKIVDVETSSVALPLCQYLRKELIGSQLLDFCHPNDVATVQQHLKDTLETGMATCGPTKFHIGGDRYVRVKMKSKRFQSSQGTGEFILSSHAVIRDNENISPVFDSPKSTPSPNLTSTSSGSCSSSGGSGSTSDSSSGVNGSIVLSPLAMSNSFGNYPTSSAGNTSEFQVSDLVLDMFPNPSWPLDSNSSQTKDLDGMNVASSPRAAPASNHSSESSAAASPTNSAFISGLSSNRNSSAATSPAVPNRASTPYSGSCYSPVASQSVSGKISPPRALPAKADSLICSSSETSGINSISQGIRQDRLFDLKSNQKLRNLLTQNISDVASRKISGLQSQEEVTILSDTHSFDDSASNQTHVNAREIPNVPRTINNVILRDLLNQDDDDSDVPVEPIERNSEPSNSFLNVVPCKVTESSTLQQRLGNNNMLRKLLNNDDTTYRKSQDFIHQLLLAGSGNKSSFQNDHIKIENLTSPQGSESYVPKPPSSESSRLTAEISFISETGLKRRTAEKFLPSTSAKRPAHAHLAGQNPMLASMLAQTPKTPPSVPTSVASTIMTQLPQERLPKNLEKKLVHTPYTTISVAGLSTSTQSLSPILINSTIQKDIVTSDSRGHVMQPTLNVDQSGIKPNYPQQVYIDKILNSANDSAVIARSLGLSFTTINSAAQNSTTFSHHLSQNNQTTATASVSLADILNEATLVDVGSLPESVQTNQASDPVFAEILEQIYSLQEDHKVETPRGAGDHSAILKLLGEVIDAPQANVTSRSIPITSAQDINEKIAISAIQKELMEGSTLAIASRATNLQNSAIVPTYSQAGRTGTQVSGTPVVQTLTAEQILLLQQQQLVNNALPPQYSLIANRVKLPSQTQSQLINSPELLAQAVQRRNLQLVRNTYLNIGNANVNQVKKNLKQQRLYLQQQQKRLLEQQQKQQFPMQTQQNLDVINSPGTSSFPENMNDLLNNTVAPNVTLLPSTGLPEASSSARFNLTLANPLPSPTSQTSPPSAQLSPGQRCTPRSPFSPLSQQPFPSQTPPPSSYQAARLSPHPPPSYPQERSSHSPSSLSSLTPTGSPHMVLSPQATTGSSQWSSQRVVTSPIQNLQLQNPMLNAQLSQQASTAVAQVRLSSQQRQQQQFRVRSLPSPSSQGSNKSTSFPSASDVSYSAVSPAMVLQSQTQQQRAQRTASVSSRISTSQSPSNFISGESVLSPQSLPSPNLIQSATSTATTFMSATSPGIPITYTVSPSNQQFTFDRQNIQVFASNSDRLTPIAQVSSDAIRQEMSAGVGPRQQNQQLSQPSGINQTLSSNSVAQVLNVSLTREALEELGLTMELLPGADSQPQALYSQALLNVASTLESSPQPRSSPNVQVELEPTNQKKSLLQQLLSEPTT